MQKKVLVTGGAGYIGSHTCKALSLAGFIPVTYDSLITGHAELVKWGPFERGDINDLGRLSAVIALHQPVAVIHFAGLIAVGESTQVPLTYYQANVSGTITLLEAMRQAGLDKIVFSSSAAVYGNPAVQPISEQSPLNPTSPYGQSKLMAEQILADCASSHGLNWMALRYFNASGADPAGETGECHEPETHLIPRALMAAAGQIDHLDLFGTTHPTPDGTCIRDYIHVSDLAALHVAALEYLLAGHPSMVLNLGAGVGASVAQVIKVVEQVTGQKIKVTMAPARPGDPAQLVADPAHAQRVFGVPLKYSDLETIVGTAWEWAQR